MMKWFYAEQNMAACRQGDSSWFNDVYSFFFLSLVHLNVHVLLHGGYTAHGMIIAILV